MAVNDVYRVQVNMVAGSQPSMNILHLRETVAKGATEDGCAAVIKITENLYNLIKPELSEDWRVISMRANIASPAFIVPPDVVIFGGASEIKGGVTQDMVPSNAPLLVSLYTLIAGRRGIGRIFLPGTPEGAHSDGQITVGFHGSLQPLLKNDLENEKGPIGAGTGKYRFVVWNAPNTPSADNHIRKVILRPNLATLRSRRAFEAFAT